ncbi:MAG TPA: beta-N-acetylhexosaminidase, partial [Candidatus Methylomirabilis sp.]
ALTHRLRRLTPDLPPLIAVDQEGGRVARLADPFTIWPPARALGVTASEDLAFQVGQAMGEELAAAGFTMDMAPVLDVDTNAANPIIGDRSFGGDPALVGRLGGALARGLAGAGVLAVGKHFPGHGDTAADSHHTLPVVPHDRNRLLSVEVAPFRAAAPHLPAVMSAHVLYPALDAEHPATLSADILTDLLRRDLGYDGLVISDDLEMAGIALRWPAGEAACRFLQAGGDLVLACHRPQVQREALAALRRAVGRGEIPASRLEEARERVRRARAQAAATAPRPRPPLPGPDGFPAHRALAARLAGRGG